MSSNAFPVTYPSWFWNSHRSPRWVNNLPQSLRNDTPNPLRTSSVLPSGNHISAASGNAQLLPTAGMPSHGSPDTVMSPASGQAILDYNYGDSASHDACRMVQYPLSIMRAGSTNSSEPLEHVGHFTTDSHYSTASSRYLAVGGISKVDLDSGNLVEFLEKTPVKFATEKVTKVDGNAVTLFLFFENIENAENLLKSSTLASSQISKNCLTALQFYDQLLTSPRASLISLFEGQVLFSTRLQAFSDSYSRSTPYGEALNLALSCGKIRAYAVLPLRGAEIRVRVEFVDISAAMQAIRLYGHNVGGHKYRSIRVYTQNYLPAGYRPRPHPSIESSRRHDSVMPQDFENVRLVTLDSHKLLAEPLFPLSSQRRQVARQEHCQPHNILDIKKVEAGVDVRTTIMLRNIPNKITAEELKEFVDTVGESFGRYDFLYLRIDFNNNCNVGYAFINFVKSDYIIPFYETMAGRHWSAYNSDKIAEISYATIQGKDCLIQKFRNSSVMEEWHGYRPKLFYSNGHPNCGEEEPFPPPNNLSKLRRSLDNAQTLGLFPPRRSSSQLPYHDVPARYRMQLRAGISPDISGLRNMTSNMIHQGSPMVNRGRGNIPFHIYPNTMFYSQMPEPSGYGQDLGRFDPFGPRNAYGF